MTLQGAAYGLWSMDSSTRLMQGRGREKEKEGWRREGLVRGVSFYFPFLFALLGLD